MADTEYAPGLAYELARYSEQFSVLGHRLTLVPEEPAVETEGTVTYGMEIGPIMGEGKQNSGSMSVMLVRGSWTCPWLRARCSCGWKAKRSQRTTLAENSVARWSKHLPGDGDAG